MTPTERYDRVLTAFDLVGCVGVLVLVAAAIVATAAVLYVA